MGNKLYKGLIRTALERDRAFRGELSARECKALDGALAKLERRARKFIEQEQAAG